jgi:hypothetical protein
MPKKKLTSSKLSQTIGLAGHRLLRHIVQGCLAAQTGSPLEIFVGADGDLVFRRTKNPRQAPGALPLLAQLNIALSWTINIRNVIEFRRLIPNRLKQGFRSIAQ